MTTVNRIIEMVLTLGPEGEEELWRGLARRGVNPFQMTPQVALVQAQEVGGNDFLREVASRSPECAVEYARTVDKGPHPVTRKAACKHPNVVCVYARTVDKGPRADTREAACRQSDSALEYARKVDKEPHPMTRKAACKFCSWALSYALYVDERFHPETWAVVKDSIYRLNYVRSVDVPEEYL